MIPLTLADVAELTGGTLAHADPATVVTGSVEFDSREITPGGLFVALTEGVNTDGHTYAAAAVERGAVAVIASRDVGDTPAVMVSDTLTALAALATGVHGRLPDAITIGITGSSGKTSTKDMVAGLAARLGPTVAPPESFNNEIGHPHTVLRATADTRYLVLEKSARNIGHIAYLCGIARPRIGVVLNVGSAHAGKFGSKEAIAKAKGELVESLPPAAEGGVAVLNADDPLVLGMRSRTVARVVTFGQADSADVRAVDVTLDEAARPAFTLVTASGQVPVRLAVHGAHQVGNALAAAAVALELGMALPDVAAALRELRAASRWRMDVTVRPDGVTVINDAYNANPESMRAALRALATIGAGRRRWAVLGHMAELGDTSEAEHESLGRFAAETGIERVLAVGEDTAGIVRGDPRAEAVPDAAAALDLLRRELAPGDVVLVKASRAIKLERLALALLEEGTG
ncbi:MAG: UDP-N-acetylmuramoyl-tripeptide--D-alanyl-D-alanine ligase [Mycobacteriales bacterium]